MTGSEELETRRSRSPAHSDHGVLLRWCLLLVAAATPIGCAASPYDYGAYLEHMPRSILVLPPLNESPEPEAAYAFLATVTRPLAERGYYVFPVAVVDHMMKENGLPTPGEMHRVSLQKIDEIIGADAVLYAVIKEWGTRYQLLNSQTSVAVDFRLVDVKSGDLLWAGSARLAQNSSGGSFGLIGMAVGAVVDQVTSAFTDPAFDLAEPADEQLFLDSHHGLLPGPRHPEHDAAVADHRQRLEASRQ